VAHGGEELRLRLARCRRGLERLLEVGGGRLQLGARRLELAHQPAQPLGLARRALGQAVIDQRTREAEGDDHRGGEGDADREPLRRHRLLGQRDRRVGGQHDGSHGREVQADDAEHEHGGRLEIGVPAGAVERNPQRNPAGAHADHKRRDDHRDVPVDLRRDAHCRHAGEVHAADRGADDRAPERLERGSPAEHDADREAEQADHDRDDDGESREQDVVADRQTRLIGELRDEMRRPYAAADDRRAGREPGPAPARAARFGGAAHDGEPGENRERADEGGEHDQTQVVLLRNASQNA
jgi:hypothetical protein